MAIGLATATQNAMADAATAQVNLGGAGTITIYSGTRPATANDAPTGTELATFTLSADAYADASGGTATLNTPVNTNGDNAGTATWFRLASGAGAGSVGTVFDGDVSGTGGTGDLKLNTTTISVGVNIEITAGSLTMPAN